MRLQLPGEPGRSTLVTVHVTIDPTTHAVTAEGVDLTSLIRRVTVDAVAGRQPEVFLELSQAVVPQVLEHDAVVHVVREVDANPHEVILAWLEGLDAGVLERAVLERDLGMSESTGGAFLAVLKEWVSGGE